MEKKKENIMINSGTGINLIPQVSKEEVVVQEKKLKVSLGAVLILFSFVLISFAIVGYNFIMKTNARNEKNKLYALEEEAGDKVYLLAKNNEIKDKIMFFDSIVNESVSQKDVLTYWKNISNNLAEIDSVELTQGVNFSVSGKADSLSQVAKLWHFLSIDEKISKVNLKGLGQSESGVTFEFDGQLNYEDFK